MKVLQHVYTNNPFYLISALLVLFGLKAIFPSGESASYDWVLMGSLATYIAILVIVATLIVRKGKVWEDARSILLVIAMLLVALSVSFDAKVIAHPGIGGALLLGGLVFSTLVSEAVLRGLRIRLLALYRGPYYLILGGFFLYPVFLSCLVRWGSPGTVDWWILGFPVLFAIALLSLVPALRRGAHYARDNGTPWPWPWFPCLVFAFLALCACARAYYFSLSFGMGRGSDSTFAPYFLVPIVLAASVLKLEVGLSLRSRRLQWVALATPICVPILCLMMEAPGPQRLGTLPLLSPAQVELQTRLLETLAAPAFIALAAMVAFYAYAHARRAPYADCGIVLAVLAFSCITPSTQSFIDFSYLERPQILPIAAASVLQLVFAIARPVSWRFFAGLVGLVAAAGLAFDGTWFVAWNAALPIHLGVAIALLLGAICKDAFADGLRKAGTAVLLIGVFAVVYPFDTTLRGIPAWAVILYSLAVPLVLVVYGLWIARMAYCLAGLLAVLVWLPRLVWKLGRLIWSLEWNRGTLMLLAGMGFLLLAVGISLKKAGAFGGGSKRAGGGDSGTLPLGAGASAGTAVAGSTPQLDPDPDPGAAPKAQPPLVP
jgi:hypothetical protein